MISAPANFTTANAVLVKRPIFIITIAGYSRVFTNYATGVGGQYDWLESYDDLQITISELDGGADIQNWSFTVNDGDLANPNAITGDFPGFTFEGKAVTVTTGFVGMSQSDFALLFTGAIDTVASSNNNQCYQFNCIDNNQTLSQVIYQTADDGYPTDSNHLKTLNAHPLDILVDVLVNQVGLAPLAINQTKIDGYRDGIFAGIQFKFEIDSPPAAKDFIEAQILKPLGGYLWTNNKGQVDVNFFFKQVRPSVWSGCLIAAWTDSTGQLVKAPFAPGLDITLVAPTGATQLQLGVDDNFWTDNSGSWVIAVNGTNYTVSCTAGPWQFTGGINSAYPYGNASASAPTVVSGITAGQKYRIQYVSGLVSLHLGAVFRDANGLEPQTDPLQPNMPGIVAIQPFTIPSSVFSITEDNMVEVPLAEQTDLINTVTFRMDNTSGGSSDYATETTDEYTPSISLYGQYGQQIIEAAGMRSGLQGIFLAERIANMIFKRYGSKNLMFTEVDLLWTACVLEPGDIVDITSSHVPDRVAGVMGISAKLFEVFDRTWDFNDGIVKVRLLDASYLATAGTSLIAESSVPAWTSATTDEKAEYMFLANNSDQQSDGSASPKLV
jgi:hypothetical protein